jgi:UDP-glucose 4-epimerase
MRILVTGHRGNVGGPVARQLVELGYDVAGFDRVEGDDLLDLGGLTRAAAGCAAVVHLGALAHDTAGGPEQIMAVNVLGTWHMLLAAEAAGAERIIHFSSAQVFGRPATTGSCCVLPISRPPGQASTWRPNSLPG